MDENKQITPSEEITDTETLEVVGNRKQCGRNRKEKYIRFKTKKGKRG